MNTYLKTQLRKVMPMAIFAIVFVMSGCSGKTEQASSPQAQTEIETEEETEASTSTSSTPALEVIDPKVDKGIGPISTVEIKALDPVLADKGRVIFESKCSACHKFDTKYVGPALKGVTTSRTPEWVMNMILNPEEMTKKNAAAAALLEEHLTQMTFQDVTQDEARAIYEYFRLNDSK